MIKRTLSVLALGGLLVAGCSAGTTEVTRDSAAPSPMVSTPVVSATESVESPTVIVPSETPPDAPSPDPTGGPVPVNTDVAPPPPAEPAPTSDVSISTSASTAASTPASSGGSWAAMEVDVMAAADAKKLTGTSPDFQAFMAESVSAPDASGCQSEFTILAFHPDGYASGQEFAAGCGGSLNIWGKVGGTWKTLMTMQSVVECTEMASNGIPKGIPDVPCLDGSGNDIAW